MSHPHHNIIDAVISLWQLATPAVEIAKRLRLDQATTLYVIKHGELPARQMTLQFTNKKSPTSGI